MVCEFFAALAAANKAAKEHECLYTSTTAKTRFARPNSILGSVDAARLFFFSKLGVSRYVALRAADLVASTAVANLY